MLPSMKREELPRPGPFRPIHSPSLSPMDRHGFPKKPQQPLPLSFLASVYSVATQNMLKGNQK